jgi:hypothetical protein
MKPAQMPSCFSRPTGRSTARKRIAMNREASTQWLLEAIERIEETGDEARRAIGDGVASVEAARERLVAGAPVSEVVSDLMAQGGRDKRLKSSAAIAAFEHAVMEYRAGLIRAMVDDEKLSFVEIATRMGVSRQLIARLYRTSTTGLSTADVSSTVHAI